MDVDDQSPSALAADSDSIEEFVSVLFLLFQSL